MSFNPEFYKELKSKSTDKDFDWIRDNIDVAEYNKFLKENLKKNLKGLIINLECGLKKKSTREISREKAQT